MAINEFAGTITSSPGGDVQGSERQRQRLGPGGDAHRVLGLAPSGERGFEALDERTAGECSAARDLLHGVDKLVEQFRIVIVHHRQR